MEALPAIRTEEIDHEIENNLGVITVDENGTINIAPIKITTADQYVEVCNNLKDTIKPFRQKVADWFQKIEKPFKEAMDNLRGERQTRLAKIDAVITVHNQAIVGWQKEQNEIRLAQEKAAREAALKAEEERRMEKAQQLIDRGEEKAAEAVLAAPIKPSSVMVAPVLPAQKVAGVSTRENWTFEVEDTEKFFAWCCENTSRAQRFLVIREPELNNLSRQTKGKQKIPGVRFFSKTSVATSKS